MLLKTKTMKFIKRFLPIFLIFLSFPIVSHGFIFDAATAALDGLSEATGPTFALYFFSFIFYILALAALFITTSLLQWAIDITPIALTLGGVDGGPSPVEMGWAFSVGIVNMLLILAFLAIAFSVILGIERVQLKKALPNLILVALLTNFTLLFVGMAIDVSNVLFNTVATQFNSEGGNIIFNAVEPLFAIGQDTFGTTIALLAARAVGLVVPYFNVAIQVGWIIALPLEILPSSLNFLFFGLGMSIMSLFCILFFFVFIARIFVIQILAIFAPLAFFCIIFDDTKKWFNEWLKQFVQWLFVGVIFIILLYFALAMAPVTIQLVVNNLVHFMGEFPGWLPIKLQEVICNLVLLCYFAVIFLIAKRLVPASANAVISQAAGAVKMVTPWAGALAKGGVNKFRNDLVRSREGTPEDMKGNDAIGRLNNFAYENRVSRGFNKWAQKADLAITGKKTEEHVQDRIKERGDEFIKKHGDSLPEVVNSPVFSNIYRDPASKAAIAHALTASGKGIDKIENDKEREDVRMAGINYLPQPMVAKMNALSPQIFDELEREIGEQDDEYVERIKNTKAFKIYNKISDKNIDVSNNPSINEINDVIQTAQSKMARSIDSESIKNLSSKVIDSKSFQTMALQNQSGSFFQKMFESHGSETMDKLDGRLQELIKSGRFTNRALERQIEKTPAVGVLFAGSKEILSSQRRESQQRDNEANDRDSND